MTMASKVSEEQRYNMEHGLGGIGDAVMDADMLRDVEEKIKKDPNDFRPWAARGILYFNEDFQVAIESFSRAIALRPFDGNQYYSRGRKYMSQDRFEQGLADLTLSVRLDPSDPAKWHFLGVAHYFLDEFPQAIKAFRRAIEEYERLEKEGKSELSNTPPEYDWIWMSYMQLGEKENARKCLEPVTASTMVHPLDMMYKRRVLLYKGEIPLEEYLEGVEGDAGTHDITELFGAANYCYHVRGDTKRAIDLLDELLAIPTHHHAWGYKMAVLYRDSWAKQL